MRLRKKLMPIHRWAGLTAGLVVLISAITGLGMAFRAELDPVLYPRQATATACARPVSIAHLIANARAARSNGTLDYVRINGDVAKPAALRFLNKDTLYFDRCSGAQVASQNRYQGFFGTLEWLHRGIWLPGGGILMGLGALSLLILLIGIGVYLWWPRRPRRLRQGFGLDRRLKGPAFNLGLHRTVGAWVMIPVTLSVLTGLPNAFDPLKAAIMAIGGHGYRTTQASAPATRASTIDGVFAKIAALSPNARETLVHLPQPGKPMMDAYFIDADAPHDNARTTLKIDAVTGMLSDIVRYRDASIGAKVYYYMLSFHTGELGGVLGQLLIAAGALGLIVLGYTGLSSYLRRKWRQARARSNAAATARANA